MAAIEITRARKPRTKTGKGREENSGWQLEPPLEVDFIFEHAALRDRIARIKSVVFERGERTAGWFRFHAPSTPRGRCLPCSILSVSSIPTPPPPSSRLDSTFLPSREDRRCALTLCTRSYSADSSNREHMRYWFCTNFDETRYMIWIETKYEYCTVALLREIGFNPLRSRIYNQIPL